MFSQLRDEGLLQRIIAPASAAPSIHNTQPWRFRVAGDDLLELHADPDRMLWVADPHGRALHLSCGAALLNLRLAIRAIGAKSLVWPLPDLAAEPTLLASVQITEGRPPTQAELELFDSIWQRHTSRAPFPGRPIPLPVRCLTEQAAAAEFTLLRFLDASDAAQVTALAAAAGKELAENYDHRVELCRWIETNREDGVPAAALGATPAREPAPVRDLGYVSPGTYRPTEAYESLPNLAVLATAQDAPVDWLRAGQALQRVLLTATISGLATSFLYQPIELHDMRDQHDGWWPWPEYPQMIIRFGYGPRGPRTARRPVRDITKQAI